MDGNELGERVRDAIARRKKRKIKTVWDENSLDEIFCEALYGAKLEPEDNAGPGYTQPPPPPKYPILLADFSSAEYLTINSDAEWGPFHHWSIVFPPSQPANLPVTTTLEVEREKLLAQGFKERPKEDWQRRKQKAEAARK